MKICEIFHSLQGEGIWIGATSVFVRTSGCNLDCKWCDTRYAREEGREMALDDILSEVARFKCRHVCVTGGEPLAQKDITKLINRLLGAGYHVTVETNGSLPIEELACDERMTISMDLKCPSSGMKDRMLLENLELLGPNDQLKFVIADDTDYIYAREVVRERTLVCEVVMQPEGGKDIKELAEKVLKDKLNVRVLPQLHKLIWGDRRGV